MTAMKRDIRIISQIVAEAQNEPALMTKAQLSEVLEAKEEVKVYADLYKDLDEIVKVYCKTNYAHLERDQSVTEIVGEFLLKITKQFRKAFPMPESEWVGYKATNTANR